MALVEVWEESWEEGCEVDDPGFPVPELTPVALPDDRSELLALGHAIVDKLNAGSAHPLPERAARAYAEDVAEFSARAAALEVDAAALVDERGHDRRVGFGSTRSWVKHHLRLSGPTALARTQTMRMFALLPVWADAARAGRVGTDQTLLMARVAANPRIQLDLIANVQPLLNDARHLPYDEFERRLRDFERSADDERARTDAEAVQERRDATMKLQPDGSWKLSATFGSLDGAEVNEVFAHFIDAEWQADLAEARDRVDAGGDDGEAPTVELQRCEPQRRADAVLNMSRAAASSPGNGKQPLPTLNVLIDEETLRRVVEDEPLDPTRYDEMVCRTQAGDAVDVTQAAALTLWGHVRRVVHDGAGTVIDLGRRRRLFTGSARDAALLLSMRCLWPGCDRPSRNCEVDHAVEWRQHGPTAPRNGGPMCKGHNLLKERGGFTAHRRPDGDWIVLDSDGNPVG